MTIAIPFPDVQIPGVSLFGFDQLIRARQW
jgi:hypothetical protein